MNLLQMQRNTRRIKTNYPCNVCGVPRQELHRLYSTMNYNYTENILVHVLVKYSIAFSYVYSYVYINI